MTSFEVAIVGAGPAGAGAARLLAAWGHSVALLAGRAKALPHNTGPRHDLAESIPPSCRKLFAAIGVLDAIEREGFYRSSGNTVWWESDEPRRELFADGALGYQVERGAFDRVMRSCATAASARLIEADVRDVVAAVDDVRVDVGEGEGIRARFALDCSGRTGVVARRGWRIDLPGQLRTVALVGVWTRTTGWPDVDPTHTLVESYGDGWAWSVPLSTSVRYVTAMIDPQRTDLARGRSASDVYFAELRKATHLARAIEDAELQRGPWGCDASVYTAREFARAPVLLVGDAASFVDPLSSFGIKKALASAWLAAIAVHTSLRNSAMTGAALEFFAAREAQMATELIEQSRAHFGAAAQMHPSPFWADRATPVDMPATKEPDVRVLRDDPRVQQAFAVLKGQSGIALRAGTSLRIERRPVVRGNEIVLEDRLFTPEMIDGMRFLRDVDVVGLHALAPGHHDVPALYDAYNRRFPPVALPDFLGALSVMLAYGVITNEYAGVD